MGGEHRQPDQAGTGVPAEPRVPDYESPKFRRGLDGKIYHYPPMYERLATLRRRFSDSLSAVTLMTTLPLTGIVLMVVLVVAMPFFFSTAAGLLVLVFGGLLGVGIYFLVKSFFQTKLSGHHDQIMHRLLTTDLPVLVADESTWQRVRDQAQGVPQLTWFGVPSLGKFEQNILFAASYIEVIEGFQRSPGPAQPNKLRHGSCLNWLTSGPAGTFGWATACSCLTPYINTITWFMFFPLIIGTNRYIELAGTVTALCDFFMLDADEMGPGMPLPRPVPGPGPQASRRRGDQLDDTLAGIQRRAGSLQRRDSDDASI